MRPLWKSVTLTMNTLEDNQTLLAACLIDNLSLIGTKIIMVDILHIHGANKRVLISSRYFLAAPLPSTPVQLFGFFFCASRKT